MVAQLREPVRRLELLVAPATPPVTARITYGYRRGRDYSWELTEAGREAAAVAQRILLSYALGFKRRAELAERYSLSKTEIQYIIRGERTHWFTDPIRARLLALGIGNARMNRSHARALEIRAALEALAAQASDMLIWPERYYSDQKSEVSTDLYLLSGAWREEEAQQP